MVLHQYFANLIALDAAVKISAPSSRRRSA
jgi:hypothetical protein